MILKSRTWSHIDVWVEISTWDVSENVQQSKRRRLKSSKSSNRASCQPIMRVKTFRARSCRDRQTKDNQYHMVCRPESRPASRRIITCLWAICLPPDSMSDTKSNRQHIRVNYTETNMRSWFDTLKKKKLAAQKKGRHQKHEQQTAQTFSCPPPIAFEPERTEPPLCLN